MGRRIYIRLLITALLRALKIETIYYIFRYNKYIVEHHMCLTLLLIQMNILEPYIFNSYIYMKNNLFSEKRKWLDYEKYSIYTV